MKKNLVILLLPLTLGASLMHGMNEKPLINNIKEEEKVTLELGYEDWVNAAPQTTPSGDPIGLRKIASGNTIAALMNNNMLPKTVTINKTDTLRYKLLNILLKKTPYQQWDHEEAQNLIKIYGQGREKDTWVDQTIYKEKNLCNIL